MQESTFTNYDQLPLFLNANAVAQVLGVSISSAYELMHETGFPALRIGNRIVVKDKLPQMSEDEMLKLLATDGMLVKRPLLVSDEFVLVGFKETEWTEQLKNK